MSTRPRDGGETKRLERENRRLVHAARREVELRRTVDERGHNPAEVLQEALDSLVAELRFAQSEVDALSVSGLFVDGMIGLVPHHWVKARDFYLQRVENCAKDMVRLGLAERTVRVQEAQAVLVAQAVRKAMEAEGLSVEQVRGVGARLRELSAESGPSV